MLSLLLQESPTSSEEKGASSPPDPSCTSLKHLLGTLRPFLDRPASLSCWLGHLWPSSRCHCLWSTAVAQRTVKIGEIATDSSCIQDACRYAGQPRTLSHAADMRPLDAGDD